MERKEVYFVYLEAPTTEILPYQVNVIDQVDEDKVRVVFSDPNLSNFGNEIVVGLDELHIG